MRVKPDRVQAVPTGMIQVTEVQQMVVLFALFRPSVFWLSVADSAGQIRKSHVNTPYP